MGIGPTGVEQRVYTRTLVVSVTLRARNNYMTLRVHVHSFSRLLLGALDAKVNHRPDAIMPTLLKISVHRLKVQLSSLAFLVGLVDPLPFAVCVLLVYPIELGQRRQMRTLVFAELPGVLCREQ